MATAKQLPSGAWRVQVYAGKDAAGNRQYKSFTATTQRKAELAALEWQEHYKEITSDNSNMTLSEAAEKYIELKSNVLSPSTIKGYTVIANNRLNGIGQYKLNKLTRNNLQAYYNALSAEYSPKSVHNTYCFITAVMAQFCPEITLGKITLPQKKKPSGEALSKQETATLINSIDGDPIEIPILLGLWLGMRRSEICALTWSDIDFERKTLSIDKALVPDKDGKFVIKPPKTVDSTRTLKLPDYLLNKLQKVTKGEPNERIVEFYPDNISKRFKRICQKCGIGDYHFHDLRRSMATVGLSLNIADKLVMARGGWNNPATMKIYIRLFCLTILLPLTLCLTSILNSF